MRTIDGVIYLTTDEVATRLGVSLPTAQSTLWKERLGAVKVGRDLYYPLDAIEAFDRRDFDRRYK